MARKSIKISIGQITTLNQNLLKPKEDIMKNLELKNETICVRFTPSELETIERGSELFAEKYNLGKPNRTQFLYAAAARYLIQLETRN